MGSESKIGQFFSRLGDKLNEQVWFQQLKTKWEELDPQSKTYLRTAGIAGSALLAFILVVSSIWSVRSLKNELAEKSDLINLIQSGNDELRRLRESTPGGGASAGGAASAPWAPYLEQTAGNAGVPREGLTVSAEKEGKSSEQAKESLFDVSVKKVNIKQLVRYAFQLENGQRPVKLRNLTIDTKPDLSGYLDATLSVSAFSLKQ